MPPGAELRPSLGAILAAEEADPPQWHQAVRLIDELQEQIASRPGTKCPAIVAEYLDDADIRLDDDGFAKRQRDRVRDFVRTGRVPHRVGFRLWPLAAAIALAVLAAYSLVS
jgi:hypothetical protein